MCMQATQLPLKIFIRGEKDNYCATEPRLGALTPAETADGGWARFSIPIETFGCYALGDMTHLEFQNTNSAGAKGFDVDAPFCLGEVELQR